MKNSLKKILEELDNHLKSLSPEEKQKEHEWLEEIGKNSTSPTVEEYLAFMKANKKNDC